MEKNTMFMKKNPNGTYSNDSGLWCERVCTSKATGLIALSRTVITKLEAEVKKRNKPDLLAPNKRISDVKSKAITLPSNRSPITPEMAFCLYTIKTPYDVAVTK